MSRHRRKKPGEGLAEAQAALEAASRDLQASRDRWPAVHALTRRATRASSEARRQKIENHLGETFRTAMGEG